MIADYYPAIVAPIVESLVVRYASSPEDINCGDCESFACDLVEALDDRGVCAVVAASNDLLKVEDDELRDIHWWAYCHGRHYDSERPRGVEDWLDLPIFVRWRAVRPLTRADALDLERKRLEVTTAHRRRTRMSIRRSATF